MFRYREHDIPLADALHGNARAISGLSRPQRLGQRSLMRVAPIALAYLRAPEQALRFARLSSETTHGGVEAADACRFFVGLLLGAFQGKSKEELLSPDYEPFEGAFAEEPLCAPIAEIARGSYKMKEPPEIRAGGYVVPALEAALWAFYWSDSFEEAALKAVNLGEDADTVGAIVGQIAGAYYGVSGIPETWRELIAQADMITAMAVNLYRKFNRPYGRSYWAAPGLLLCGFVPGDSNPTKCREKLSALLDCGATCFVNLMEESEVNWEGKPFTPYQGTLFELAEERGINVSYARIPIIDQDITNVATMKRILDVIDGAHRDGQCVYLHCWGGKGRTGSVVGCWFTRHGLSPHEALDYVKELRDFAPDDKADEPSPENDEQRGFVLAWRAGQ